MKNWRGGNSRKDGKDMDKYFVSEKLRKERSLTQLRKLNSYMSTEVNHDEAKDTLLRTLSNLRMGHKFHEMSKQGLRLKKSRWKGFIKKSQTQTSFCNYCIQANIPPRRESGGLNESPQFHTGTPSPIFMPLLTDYLISTA